MIRKQKNTRLVGTLLFEDKKILFQTESEVFFVHSREVPPQFLHGDLVLAKIIKPATENLLAEVSILQLKARTQKTLLGYKKGKYIIPLPQIGTFSRIFIETSTNNLKNGEVVEFTMKNNKAVQVRKFQTKKYQDDEIASILFLNSVSENWSNSIRKQEKRFLHENDKWTHIEPNSQEKTLEKYEENLLSNTKNSPQKSLFSVVQNQKNERRIQLENWYIITIDGADSRDLDDAISIAQYKNGDFLLGVHIADVSYYITEGSPLDKEALKRGTSIYLPEEVIPMLPKSLSNNLCSLNPHTHKKTLTCLIRINATNGKVIHTDIFESIISSEHRGVYEEIFEKYQKNTILNTQLDTTIRESFDLYHILKNRRKKEGKLNFETTELYFDIDQNHNPQKIHKRERNDAHKLIEEFMVIANEEVAKWCTKRKIPFLSRFHPSPSDEAIKEIGNIIGKKPQKNGTEKNDFFGQISPKDIQSFLSNIKEENYYYTSRLILPKMAKAIYSANKHGHFGLALEQYSHFTSPIRRYPDLITHRMIRKYLSRQYQAKDYENVTKKLSRIAELCSFSEKKAESVEHAADRVYQQRFMKTKIGKIFSGKISGVADWGIFIELSNGIEVTVYLPRNMYQADRVTGTIIDKNQQIIYKVGEEKQVKVSEIRKIERRIIAKLV